MSKGIFSDLKAFAFTAAIMVIIYAIIYTANHYNSNLLDGGSQSVAERPRMWDVWIVSWYPLCSQRGSRSEGLELGEGEDRNRDAGRTVEDVDGFMPLSVDKVPAAVSSPQAKGTPSTQIRISSIILMPARPPRFTSPPINTGGGGNQDGGPPREYALGTFYAPYTPGG